MTQEHYCNMCKMNKQTSEFQYKNKMTGKLQPYCRKCAGIKVKACVTLHSRSNAEYRFSRCPASGLSLLKRACHKQNQQLILTANELKNWWDNAPDVCYHCSMTLLELNEISTFLKQYQGFDDEILSVKKIHQQKSAITNDFAIDRLNPNAPYAIGNMVKSCAYCNTIKSCILTNDETKNHWHSCAQKVANLYSPRKALSRDYKKVIATYSLD